MAAGDLTQRCDWHGGGLLVQLQLALNQPNVNLQSIVGDAREEAEQIEIAIGEIAAGNHDMSNRTDSQASSLQETAASMDQITSTVRANAQSARRAAQLADSAAEVTHTGLKTWNARETMHTRGRCERVRACRPGHARQRRRGEPGLHLRARDRPSIKRAAGGYFGLC